MAAGIVDLGGQSRKFALVRRIEARCLQEVTGEDRQLSCRRRLAEELGRGIDQQVRLVEYRDGRFGEEIAECGILQREVGAVEMMVDDHDIGAQRPLARAHERAVREPRAFLPEAIVARRRGQRPNRVLLRQRPAASLVADGIDGGERRDDTQLGRRRRIEMAAVGEVALEMMGTDVVGPPLEDRAPERQPQPGAQPREVLFVELVLELARPGGDHDRSSRDQRRNQVGEGLSDTGCRFGDHLTLRFDRRCDSLGQLDLAVADPVATIGGGDRPVGRERKGHALRESLAGAAAG